MTNETNGDAAGRVRLIREELLSDNWAILKKTTLEYQRADGAWQTLTRETYDRGNGATILLYNREKEDGHLDAQQFRYPAFVNQHPGLLIETCAGLLDARDPAEAIRSETEEETGYRISHPRKIMEVFMSPGSVTEKLYFFVAEYTDSRAGLGGGIAADGEDIDVVEVGLDEALKMIERGEIVDGKTIILLQYAQLHGIMD